MEKWGAIMTLDEFYQTVGGNYKEVIERIPSKDMVLRFVRRFAEDTTFSNWQTAQEKQDIQAAFRAAHTMKGIAANLGFENLTRVSEELTEQLRPGTNMGSDMIRKEFEAAYRDVIDKITKLD